MVSSAIEPILLASKAGHRRIRRQLGVSEIQTFFWLEFEFLAGKKGWKWKILEIGREPIKKIEKKIFFKLFSLSINLTIKSTLKNLKIQKKKSIFSH